MVMEDLVVGDCRGFQHCKILLVKSKNVDSRKGCARFVNFQKKRKLGTTHK